MADGRIHKWQGKILRRSGKVATADDCCCKGDYRLTPCFRAAPYPPSCDCCSDYTYIPAAYTVRFWEIEWCLTACYAWVGCSYKLYAMPEPVEVAVHWMGEDPEDPDPCSWQGEVDLGHVGDYWDAPNDDCSGAPDASHVWVRVSIYVRENEMGDCQRIIDARLVFKDDGGVQHNSLLFYWSAETKTAPTKLQCGVILYTDNQYDPDIWPYFDCDYGGFAGVRGSVMAFPGDSLTPDNPCPGGAPIYTSTDLSAYVGRVVHIAEDPDVCYQVAENTDEVEPDTEVTVTKVCDTCVDCCSEPEGESCAEV